MIYLFKLYIYKFYKIRIFKLSRIFIAYRDGHDGDGDFLGDGCDRIYVSDIVSIHRHLRKQLPLGLKVALHLMNVLTAETFQ